MSILNKSNRGLSPFVKSINKNLPFIVDAQFKATKKCS